MKITDLQNKRILIIGAGVEGKATLAFLKVHLADAVVALVDQADGENYLYNQQEYDIAIKSPGVSPKLLTISYTTATNIFFGEVKGMTIGVTGTKGKSTTASLLYAMLKQAGKKVHLVGNIGNPMLSELLTTNTSEDIWVCELSSYQISDLDASPDISLILNLFPEHMDYHGSIKAYYEAKKHLIAHATESNYLVYNPEFAELKKLSQNTKTKAVPYIDTLPFDDKKIPLIGLHNKNNVRAAATVAKLLDIPDEDIEMAVINFKALPHRLQNVGTYHGITFYDDAISTTPQSTIKAIESLPDIGTIFLGGQDRGYDFDLLAQKINESEILNVVLFPDSGKRILDSLKKYCQKLPTIFETDNTHDAIVFAYAHTEPGMICLLSPASPSYSLWKKFTVRGDEFQKEVKAFNL